MADYKKMYGVLFNKITNVIEELQQVQSETEEMYIQSTDAGVILLKPDGDDEDTNIKK